MNHTKKTRNMAYDLVKHYSKFDKSNYCYNIKISDIPDFDLNALSSQIMSEDSSYASEATGNDNPLFVDSMLPALNKYLSNSHSRDEEIEFVKSWREGVSNYFGGSRKKLIYEMLEQYNQEEGYINTEDLSFKRWFGEEASIWQQ